MLHNSTINLNPFMRFDGYYLFSGSLGCCKFTAKSVCTDKLAYEKGIVWDKGAKPRCINGKEKKTEYNIWIFDNDI